MGTSIDLRDHLARGVRARHAASVQRLRQPETAVLDNASVREAVERQVAARLLVGGEVLVALGSGGDVVQFRGRVLNCVVIGNLQNSGY